MRAYHLKVTWQLSQALSREILGEFVHKKVKMACEAAGVDNFAAFVRKFGELVDEVEELKQLLYTARA